MRQSLARLVVAAVAALLCLAAACGSAFAQGLTPKANPTADDIEQAKAAMAAGVALMQDPDGSRYEEAYGQFSNAYVRSGSLNALHNLAICAQKLELDGEAIGHYETVLKQKGADLDPNDKAQINRDLSALKATVAWVSFSSDKGQVRLIDERSPRIGAVIRNTYKIGIAQKKFGLHPGNHKFTATTDGFGPLVWTVQITPSGSFNHEFTFDKDAPVTAEGWTQEDQAGLGPGGPGPDDDDIKDDGLPVYVWIIGGVTVASAIAMGVFMGLSASKKSEYDNEIHGVAPLPEQEDAASSLKTTNLLADIFLGVTVAGAAATVILAIVSLGGDETGSSAKGPRFGVDYSVTPMVDHRGGAGAILTTRF